MTSRPTTRDNPKASAAATRRSRSNERRQRMRAAMKTKAAKRAKASTSSTQRSVNAVGTASARVTSARSNPAGGTAIQPMSTRPATAATSTMRSVARRERGSSTREAKSRVRGARRRLSTVLRNRSVAVMAPGVCHRTCVGVPRPRRPRLSLLRLTARVAAYSSTATDRRVAAQRGRVLGAQPQALDEHDPEKNQRSREGDACDGGAHGHLDEPRV